MRADDFCEVSDVYVTTCGCRKALRLEKGVRIPRCPFCGATTVWVRARTALGIATERRAPPGSPRPSHGREL